MFSLIDDGALIDNQTKNRCLYKIQYGHIMRKTQTIVTSFAAMSLAMAAPILQPKPAEAAGYDIDCAVILCLAGGFPTGCGAAYSYMIRRITSTPPKPPFGFCAMGDLSDVDFPDNDDPRAHEAMIDVIDDPGVARTLRSVRAEVARGHHMCQSGGEDGQEYRCTSMIELNGDGSNLFMGQRGYPGAGFWRRGKRVTFVDFEGNPRSMGDAEHYQVVGQECGYSGGRDGGYRCIPTFDWVEIAWPADE